MRNPGRCIHNAVGIRHGSRLVHLTGQPRLGRCHMAGDQREQCDRRAGSHSMGTGATICSASGTQEGDEVSSWVAVEDVIAGRITQAGFVQQFVVINNQVVEANCRFWATGTGLVHAYNCGNDAFGSFVYFEVTTNPLTNDYLVYDCGSDSTYNTNNCALKSSATSAYLNPLGAASSEVSYACGDHMAAASGTRVNIGTTPHHSPVKPTSSDRLPSGRGRRRTSRTVEPATTTITS